MCRSCKRSRSATTCLSGDSRYPVTSSRQRDRFDAEYAGHFPAFPVARLDGKYRGEVAIKQRDFGIEPISVAGGAVKVEDELRVQCEIVK